MGFIACLTASPLPAPYRKRFGRHLKGLAAPLGGRRNACRHLLRPSRKIGSFSGGGRTHAPPAVGSTAGRTDVPPSAAIACGQSKTLPALAAAPLFVPSPCTQFTNLRSGLRKKLHERIQTFTTDC